MEIWAELCLMRFMCAVTLTGTGWIQSRFQTWKYNHFKFGNRNSIFQIKILLVRWFVNELIQMHSIWFPSINGLDWDIDCLNRTNPPRRKTSSKFTWFLSDCCKTHLLSCEFRFESVLGSVLKPVETGPRTRGRGTAGGGASRWQHLSGFGGIRRQNALLNFDHLKICSRRTWRDDDEAPKLTAPPLRGLFPPRLVLTSDLESCRAAWQQVILAQKQPKYCCYKFFQKHILIAGIIYTVYRAPVQPEVQHAPPVPELWGETVVGIWKDILMKKKKQVMGWLTPALENWYKPCMIECPCSAPGRCKLACRKPDHWLNGQLNKKWFRF